MTQHFLSAEHTIYEFDPHRPAALTVQPGDTVTFELQDVGRGQFRSGADLYDPATYDNEHDHPMTGPVAIAGAEPGDILRVDIDRIELWDWGFILLAPEHGVLRHRINRRTRIVAIQDGFCVFDERIRFPVHPMVGTIGVAPSGPAVRGVLPGAHGGNLDNRWITDHSTVLLPVSAPGAGLALADLHAAMGDGECCISGVETGGRVTVTVDLIKGKTIRQPIVETGTAWMTHADGDRLEPAIRTACEQMLDLLVEEWGLGPEEAFMLMSVQADIGICQCASPGDFPCVVRVSLPRLPGIPGPLCPASARPGGGR